MIDHDHVCANLLTRKAMVDSSEFVRAFDDLQTTIFLVGRSQGNHDADQLVGKQKLVLIPITIVLVPFPGATNLWFFLHQFGMKMTDRCITV